MGNPRRESDERSDSRISGANRRISGGADRLSGGLAARHKSRTTGGTCGTLAACFLDMFTEPAPLTAAASASSAAEAQVRPVTAVSTRSLRFWLGHKTYWASQIGGWGGGLLLGIWGELMRQEPQQDTDGHSGAVIYVSTLMGIVISHALRWVILRWRWKEQPLRSLIPRMIAASLVCGAALAAVVMPLEVRVWEKAGPGLIALVVVWLSLHFMAWGGIYFGYHYYAQLRRRGSRS